MSNKIQVSLNEKPTQAFKLGTTLKLNEKTKGTAKETVPTSQFWCVTGIRTLKAVQ